MLTFAIVGFGSRGQMFGRLIRGDENAKLVAIAEPIESNREVAITDFGLSAASCYPDADAFFAAGKLCDAVFICSQDAQHIDMAVKAMELGYDICLEKPAATTIEDCITIRDTANRLGRKVMLTHCMRYTPFYQTIKDLIDSGKLGEVVTLNQTENIAYWHFGLSYVRGPWRNMAESSPTIIAKCCHDLDIINWLIPAKVKAVSSFGNCYYFNEAHAPAGSAEWCVDCDPQVREKCLYNAYAVYPERVQRSLVGGVARLIGMDIYSVLDNKEDVIARCVFHGDNDAVDNQVVNMIFDNGATAHLTMTAFSQECYRWIKVHGTKGEIFGNMDEGLLYFTEYNKPMQTIDVNKLTEHNLNDGHGGGDYFLYLDFVDYITKNAPSKTRTTIDDSIESHVIGFKAEESRLQNGAVKMINA